MSNRVLVLSELYAPNNIIHGLSGASDTRIMRHVLDKVFSAGNEDTTEVDVQDAGTVCRFILPVLAFRKGTFILKGSARMAERPLTPLIMALRELGANIDGDQLPLTIYGSPPKIKDRLSIGMDTSYSSQFASSLLMIFPLLANTADLVLEGSRLSLPYIDMTVIIMRQMGFDVSRNGAFVTYRRGPIPSSATLTIEPDYSSIAFWVGITSLSQRGELQINAGNHSRSVQGDSVVIRRAVQNGLINIREDGDTLYMSRNRIIRSMDRVRLDFTDTPDLAIPELIMYTARGYHCLFTGIETLDYKESPRFMALAERLRPFGIEFIQKGDEHQATGNFKFPKEIQEIDPLNDHRLAMGFAMPGILHPIVIRSPNVVTKSYPSFWDDLRKVNFDLSEKT